MVMMFRFVRVWWLSRLRPRIAADQASRFSMRVWPNDLDFNVHMNNGRYFSAADLGRLDWWVRSGLWLGNLCLTPSPAAACPFAWSKARGAQCTECT